MRSCPLHYNKIGDPALQTKCWHVFQTTKRTKAYHAQGYPDISSFFQMNMGPKFPAGQQGTCHQGLKSKLGHLESAYGSRTCLEAEEVVVIADNNRNGGMAPLRC